MPIPARGRPCAAWRRPGRPSSRARRTYRDRPRGPGACRLNRPPRSVISGMAVSEEGQDALGAVGRPAGQQAMPRQVERTAAMDGHETSISRHGVPLSDANLSQDSSAGPRQRCVEERRDERQEQIGAFHQGHVGGAGEHRELGIRPAGHVAHHPTSVQAEQCLSPPRRCVGRRVRRSPAGTKRPS